MENSDSLSKAIAEILPKTISREKLESFGCDLGIKGKVTAAKGLAMALIAKALEGDMKAFSLIAQLACAPEPTETQAQVMEIRVVE